MKRIRDVQSIFLRAVASVQPRNLMRHKLRLDNGNLIVNNNTVFALQKPCHLVGFGKAVFGMALEVEKLLGENLKGGIISIPVGFEKTGVEVQFEDESVKKVVEVVSGEVQEVARRMWREFEDGLEAITNEDVIEANEVKQEVLKEILVDEVGLRENFLRKFEVFRGAEGNLPDETSLKAAQSIKSYCEDLTETDLLIVLISGGGSALLPLPVPQCSLAEKQKIIKALSHRGADICELNTVRKKLSQLKGGGLARTSFPARTVALILSDVVGDPLGFIASGATVLNTDPPGSAKEVVDKYQVEVSAEVRQVLEQEPEIWKEFSHVHNFVIGSNSLACQAAKAKAQSLGYPTMVLTNKVRGDVEDLANFYAQLAKNLAKFRQKICVISGGEPTVSVSGGGKGGRNQHLALAFSHRARQLGLDNICFLSCGTDGIDGPTDAAGAVATPEMGEGVEAWLRNNDSYNFFRNYQDGRFLVKVGHTGTNVMDIHVLIVDN